MKRTTIEEYNEQGQLVRKTVTEEGAPHGYTHYYGPYWSVCTCGTTYCPLHTPYKDSTWTITTGGTTSGVKHYINEGANQ